LHETEAQPAACRVFPFRFVLAVDRVHAAIAHRCVCGTLDRGPRIADDMDRLRARYRFVEEVHSVPESTIVDGSRRLDTRRAIDALIAATTEQDPFAILLAAADALLLAAGPSARRTTRNDTHASDRILARLHHALPPVIAKSDLPVARVLRRNEHPNARAIRADLSRAGLLRSKADPLAEVVRFVRDWIFALEPYRFSSLSAALLAIALAVSEILRGRATHPRVRTRIMLWEGALLARSLVGVVGPEGPLAEVTAELSIVRAQVARFSRIRRGD
jgi:hypothetical protein